MRKASWLAALGLCLCIPLVGCGAAVNNQTNRDATSGYAGGAVAPKTANKPGVPSVGTMRRPAPTTAATPRALTNGITTISGHTVQVDSAAKTLRLHYTGLIGHTSPAATASNSAHSSTLLHLTVPTGWNVVIYESHLRSGRLAVVRYADVQGVRPTDFSSPQLRMAARNANPRGAGTGALAGGTAADAAAGIGGARINRANPAAGADGAVSTSKPTTFRAMRPGRYAVIPTVYPAASPVPILDVITVSNTATTPTVGTFSRF